jgi:hypothetical protein
VAPHGATSVSITPGWLRSEVMLETFGVTEGNFGMQHQRCRTS